MKTENMTKEQEYKVLKLIEQAYRKGIFDCRDCNQSNSAINAHLIASQVTAFELFEQFSLYKDHLTTASGSVPKEEPKEKEIITIDVLIKKHIPNGVINLKSYEDEIEKITLIAIEYSQSELSSLRDELWQRDELIKEFLPFVYAEPNHDIWKVVSRAKSLLNKP